VRLLQQRTLPSAAQSPGWNAAGVARLFLQPLGREGHAVTCPACHYTGDPFGPAAFFVDGDKLEYVNFRRCGAMLLVGRDVEAE